MIGLGIYAGRARLPGSEAGRLGMLLGLRLVDEIDEIELADQVSQGLRVDSVDALVAYLGHGNVVGPFVSKATLSRARKSNAALSRKLSQRLYGVSLVVDAVSRKFRGDERSTLRFLTTPHQLLAQRSPVDMAASSSAGVQAVLNLLDRADAGFAV